MTRSELLKTYLAEAFERTYRVGHWDCIIFIAMWADIVESGHSCPPHGGNHTSRIRGSYTTEAEGCEKLTRSSINEAIANHLLCSGWQQLGRSGSPEVGDIILTNLNHPGIWDGEKIIAQPANASGNLAIHPRQSRDALRFSTPSSRHS